MSSKAATYNLRIFYDLPATDPGSRAKLHARLRAASQNGMAARSLSHCPLASGFVLAANGRIGLDLEDIRRISPAILRRVATAQEREGAPEARALWVAKEAAFKALSRTTPGLRVLTQLRIGNWQAAADEWHFAVMLKDGAVRSGTGIVRTHSDLILGIYHEKA
jgi:phosphopantetheinyl transferase (holo-ACP synthase)